MTKNLLILERSSTELEFKQEGGTYVLEGIFGEIDKKNRNNRIYFYRLHTKLYFYQFQLLEY